MHQKEISEMCGVLGDECRTLDIYFAGMQSRLGLGMPVDESVRIIEEKLQILIDGVEDLKEVLSNEG